MLWYRIAVLTFWAAVEGPSPPRFAPGKTLSAQPRQGWPWAKGAPQNQWTSGECPALTFQEETSQLLPVESRPSAPAPGKVWRGGWGVDRHVCSEHQTAP